MQYKLVYLASPYTHPDAKVREERFKAAQDAATRLLKKGVFAFSPIAYNHPMHLDFNLPTDWNFWKPYDIAFLERCSEVLVLQLDGWDQSVGVAAEVEFARETGIPVNYTKLEEL